MKSVFFKTGLILVMAIVIAQACSSGKSNSKNDQSVTFVRNDAEKRIDVLVEGNPFTSYCWPDNVFKPILYPVRSAEGTEVTRGFPLKPREGERNDHIHQVGIWLNYGNVNGIDFWGNGHRGIKEPEGGEIKHLSFGKISEGKGEGIIETKASWLDPEGMVLLAEETDYHFLARGSLRIIDRITRLTAINGNVEMKDTKEGMFGIRVARELELPSDEELVLLDSSGEPSDEKVPNNGVTGNYRSSEGITGDAVWSTRAQWMLLYGNIGDEKISIVICDHPDNPCYPTFWHARGYGLFSANPLGWSDFTEGEETLNFSIPAGGSVTFRYRVVIDSGSHLSDEEITSLAAEFSERY